MTRDYSFSTEGREVPSYEPVPEGWHPATIEDHEWKTTKKGNGEYLQLTIRITSGPAKGRVMWERLNLNNPNQQAVSIAESTLTAIILSCGMVAIQSPSDLHWKNFDVKVGHREYMGEAKAECKGYRAQQAVAPSSTQQQGAPWKKGA